MPKRKNYDKRALARLFADQGGLATRSQLIGLGVPPSTIRHRERPGGPWRRVLRGVCATHDHALTGGGSGALRAALLYAGPGSVVTGFAALRAHHISAATPQFLPPSSPQFLPPTTPSTTPPTTPSTVPSSLSHPHSHPHSHRLDPAPPPSAAFSHSPDPTAFTTVKVLIPSTRRRSSSAFVLISRTRRMPVPVEIEGCRVAPVARAAVDACLDTRDTELIRRIVGELVHSGRCSPTELRVELDANQTRQSARMRAVLVEFADGIRTGAEAQCRRHLARVAAPPALWNRRVVERSTGRVALLPVAVWPRHGVALDLDPAPAGRESAAARRRWISSVLRMTVAQVTPSEVRDRWDEVWAELRTLLNRPPTYQLPAGYAFA